AWWVVGGLCVRGCGWGGGVGGRAGRWGVGKGGGESVGEPARAILALALIVRLALDLVFGGDSGGLRGRETGPAGICQRAERDQFQPVTNLADLAVDVEPALQVCAGEFPERSS